MPMIQTMFIYTFFSLLKPQVMTSGAFPFSGRPVQRIKTLPTKLKLTDHAASDSEMRKWQSAALLKKRVESYPSLQL